MSPSDADKSAAVLTPIEVSEMLRMNVKNPRSAVAYLRRSGRLRGTKIGRGYKFSLAEVERFIKEG